MSRVRGWVSAVRPPYVWLPAAAGLVAGALLLVLLPRARVSLLVAPSLLVAELGLALTLVWLAVRLLSRRAGARHAAELVAERTSAQQARQRFVRRLDHELKNPLTAMLAALGGPPGPLEVVERELALKQADRIRRLLTDLRRVADVETAELESEPVQVGELLQEAADLAVADSGSNRQVRVEVPAAPWPLAEVRGDRDLLLVAVYNVVANALKYTDADDLIEVRARESGPPENPVVTVEVADTGPGIPEAEQTTVWEELARGSSATGVPGSGIGLALVDVIVRRHGGSTALQSRHGHGTAVRLQLPAAGGERRPAARH